MSIRPLAFDFTGSQDAFASISGAKVLDCTKIEGCFRYCDPAAREEILSLLRPVIFPDGSMGPAFPARWLGPGDFHYVSEIIASQEREPFDLFLLDNHPDIQAPAFGKILSCGGWVRTMLEENPMLGDVLMAGIDGSLVGEMEGTGPDGREIGSRVHVLTREDIGNSEGEELRGKIMQLILSVGSDKPIYLSVDKDVLREEYFIADWSQGTMSLSQLETAIGTIASVRNIVGADVCGGPPPSENGPSPAINLKTDTELFNYIEKILRKAYICKS